MIKKNGSMLFFVRGGDVWGGRSNPFEYAGRGSNYWSSRAYSNTSQAYDLNFWDSGVAPSNIIDRYVGQPLRCLIPTP